MNDTVKGISILTITAVAITWVLNTSNHGWDIPLFAFNGGGENRDILQLQKTILAGGDPTLRQQPTASGVPEAVVCYRGWVSVDDKSVNLIQQPYVSVVDQSQMYVRVIGQNIMLELSVDDNETARLSENVPVAVAFELADITEQEQQDCTPKNLVITSLE
ncbi:hypothetical protein [Neptunomonas antarctica]|uniref:Uncharacterized protein n=1 Tax=Neptunomonas antarctica TaxID=619304 RepID=A0A1N7LMF1_9GAMM|nr:hypothetical protein [Neptunomonas antarctica]SIS74962.1 hypothetical protein SAMN05421760_104155 [Neptunomonas antarctica]